MHDLQITQIPTNNLIEYARNPRKNDDVIDKMCSSIREFGFRIPIIAKSNGEVVDGHLRLKAARKLDIPEVPVILADDLSESQIKAFRLLANKSANWADWDEELLALELEDLKDLDFDLELTGFDLDEINYIFEKNLKTELGLDNTKENGKNELPLPELPPEGKIISKPGDLWILGNHRLLC